MSSLMRLLAIMLHCSLRLLLHFRVKYPRTGSNMLTPKAGFTFPAHLARLSTAYDIRDSDIYEILTLNAGRVSAF